MNERLESLNSCYRDAFHDLFSFAGCESNAARLIQYARALKRLWEYLRSIAKLLMCVLQSGEIAINKQIALFLCYLFKHPCFVLRILWDETKSRRT